MLPTNPYSIAIPGGKRGPMMFDFATSKIAGGWIYAARSAGARLPDAVLLDSEGRVSRDPEDYFRGGAILPACGHKGYALALAAEIMAEALLGPIETEGFERVEIPGEREREHRAMSIEQGTALPQKNLAADTGAIATALGARCLRLLRAGNPDNRSPVATRNGQP